jgi:polyisoprenoid-binding protein YceI
MTITHPAQDNDQLAGTRWRLDPSGSSAGFRVPNFWGLTADTGRFERLDGRLEVDDGDRWRMEMTIDATSLETGNARRDGHLRSPAFFHVERYPEVRFRSSSVRDRGGGRLEVEGELEAAGGSVPLRVDVTVEHAGGRLVLDAAATVDQRQLGMTFSPLGMIRSPTALSVHARLRREDGPSRPTPEMVPGAAEPVAG